MASGVTAHHGVEFAVVEGFRPLLLDLYLPTPDSGSGAAMVYLHGGGWAVGTRRRFGRAFASWSPTAARPGRAGRFRRGHGRLPAQRRSPVPGPTPRREGGHPLVARQRGRARCRPGAAVRVGRIGRGTPRRAGGSHRRPARDGGDVGEFSASPAPSVASSTGTAPMNLLSLGSQHRPGSDKRPDDAGSWESTLVGAPLQTDPARTVRRVRSRTFTAALPRSRSTMAPADTVPFAQSVEFVEALRAAGGDSRIDRRRRQRPLLDRRPRPRSDLRRFPGLRPPRHHP